MQSILTDHNGNRTTFRIEGDLRGKSVLELEKSWRRESKEEFPKSMCIDLRAAGTIAQAGRILLSEMLRTGIEILIPAKHRDNKNDQRAI